MESVVQQEKRIGLYFHISIYIKGIISLAEIVGGILAFIVPFSFVPDLIIRFTSGELAEEPTDFIATHLVTLAHSFALASATFVGLYLLSRGLIKFALIVALLKNKLWAYPISLVVLGLFVLYQIYQIVSEHSAFVILLTIFDLIVMWFIWKEYKILKLHHSGNMI